MKKEEKIAKAGDLLCENYGERNYHLSFSEDESDGILLTKETLSKKIKTFKNWDSVIKYLEEQLLIK